MQEVNIAAYYVKNNREFAAATSKLKSIIGNLKIYSNRYYMIFILILQTETGLLVRIGGFV